MTPVRLAVIDLGSNTFHLLIVEILADGSWTSLLKDRRYVKLASGGLATIRQDSIDRATQVMKEFASQIEEMNVTETLAIGTAALREAKNGSEVAEQLTAASGIHITIIDGHTEADYILTGIQSALPTMDAPCLIMDIGGGSVEFILFDHHKLLFTGSYMVGVAVLHRSYHHHDPILLQEVEALENHVTDELQLLFDALQEAGPFYLIGASGSFEVIQDIMPKIQESLHWSELSLEGLENYLSDIIKSDITNRRLRPEIPVERLDYIVVAYLLIRLVIRKHPPKRLFYCDYALKEGIIEDRIAKYFRQV